MQKEQLVARLYLPSVPRSMMISGSSSLQGATKHVRGTRCTASDVRVRIKKNKEKQVHAYHWIVTPCAQRRISSPDCELILSLWMTSSVSVSARVPCEDMLAKDSDDELLIVVSVGVDEVLELALALECSRSKAIVSGVGVGIGAVTPSRR